MGFQRICDIKLRINIYVSTTHTLNTNVPRTIVVPEKTASTEISRKSNKKDEIHQRSRDLTRLWNFEVETDTSFRTEQRMAHTILPACSNKSTSEKRKEKTEEVHRSDSNRFFFFWFNAIACADYHTRTRLKRADSQ